MSKKEKVVSELEPLVDVSGFKKNYQDYANTPLTDDLPCKIYAIAAEVKEVVEEEMELSEDVLADIKKRLEGTVNRIWRIAIDTQLLKNGGGRRKKRRRWGDGCWISAVRYNTADSQLSSLPKQPH